MAPVRPEDHDFVFQATVLAELRRELGFSQANLAELLDVPVNTLSRWERGSNVPDANALAALFSVAKERGVTPEFFKARRNAIMNRGNRKTLVVQWDHQNMGLNADDIADFNSELREYIQLIFPEIDSVKATAYLSANNWNVGNALGQAGFEVKSSYFNVDRQLIQEGQNSFELPQKTDLSTVLVPHAFTSYPGALLAHNQQRLDPGHAVYVLISNDGGYADSLGRLKRAGIETFVCGYTSCSQQLVKAVGSDHFIPWQRPYMIGKCYEVATKLADKPITKSAFGNQCRVALEEDGWEEEDDYVALLEDTGFSLNRPFASVLQHMNTLGILRTKASEGDPNRITLRLPRGD